MTILTELAEILEVKEDQMELFVDYVDQYLSQQLYELINDWSHEQSIKQPKGRIAKITSEILGVEF